MHISDGYLISGTHYSHASDCSVQYPYMLKSNLNIYNYATEKNIDIKGLDF